MAGQAMALRALADESGEVVRAALEMDCLASVQPEAVYSAAKEALHGAMAQLSRTDTEAASSARGSAKKVHSSAVALHAASRIGREGDGAASY